MKLGLGTVQFGLDYGVSNQSGKTPAYEISKILNLATERGVTVIDTAAAYGDSESALGSAGFDLEKFKVVTKTVPVGVNALTQTDILKVETRFKRSLENLKLKRVDGLLIHYSSDLLCPGGDKLFRLLDKLKAERMVKKIGVSVYNEREIETILANYPVDLVQLPLSIFDQRLIDSGHLQKLKNKNVEIHVRSVFLQGLMFLDENKLPKSFEEARAAITRLKDFAAKSEKSLTQIALGFVSSLKEVDSIVCGVNNAEQFQELLLFVNSRLPSTFDRNEFKIISPEILNPSNWKAHGL